MNKTIIFGLILSLSSSMALAVEKSDRKAPEKEFTTVTSKKPQTLIEIYEMFETSKEAEAYIKKNELEHLIEEHHLIME